MRQFVKFSTSDPKNLLIPARDMLCLPKWMIKSLIRTVYHDGSIHIHFSCSIEHVRTCVDGLNACKCLDKYTMKNDFTDEMAARNAKHPGTSKGNHLLDGRPT